MSKDLVSDAEKDERTSPLGLFNTAESYWCAAVALNRAKVKSTHPHAPVSFLYYHAIELYLKAFLRLHGVGVRELSSNKLGHRTDALKERAIGFGLFLMDEDHDVLGLMATTDAVIRSRYHQTGSFRWPAIDALNRTCKSLRQTIGEAFKLKGIHVRVTLTGRLPTAGS